MSKIIKELGGAFITFGVVGFLANFFWESVQAYSLYQNHVIDSPDYTRMMVVVSLRDMFLLFSVLVVSMLIFRNRHWYLRMSPSNHAFVVVSNLLLAVFIEVRALYFENAWQYSNLMPTMFGIGLSPLLQLVVTWYLAWWITKVPFNR